MRRTFYRSQPLDQPVIGHPNRSDLARTPGLARKPFDGVEAVRSFAQVQFESPLGAEASPHILNGVDITSRSPKLCPRAKNRFIVRRSLQHHGQAAGRYPFGNRSLTQPFTPHRTYRPLSDHSVSAIARDCRACSRYSLHRYSIYFLGGIRWWILFRLNCSNYKLVLKPGAPTANTSGKRSLMNSEARRWKCSGLTRLRLFIGS